MPCRVAAIVRATIRDRAVSDQLLVIQDLSDLDFVHMALYMCSVFWHVGLIHCIIVAG